MSKLSDIQRRFSHAVQEAAREWNPEELGLRDQPPVPFTKRVAIYHYAYLARITESLLDDFEAVALWLGDNGFRDRIRPFLKHFPSRYPSLAEVSRHFPDFLKQAPNPEDPAFLPDLARFEWTWIETAVSLQRAPGPIIPMTELGNHAMGDVCFAITPSLRLFQSEWPVDALLRKTEIVNRQRICLAVFRGRDGTEWKRLRRRQFALLGVISSGQSIEAVLQKMEEFKIVPSQAQSWFAAWSSCGIIQGARPVTSSPSSAPMQ